jgi:hypothetical protein
MIKAHRQKGQGAHFIAPISELSCHYFGGLFVDDTNLFHLDIWWIKTDLEAHTRLQELVINWGKLLLAMGGALKLAKCSFFLLSFPWKEDGTWAYEINEANPDLAIGIPMGDGSLEKIEHLPCSSALKTLNLMTCPTDSNTAALDRMRQHGQEWVDKVLASTLSHRNVWFMVDCQFWPWIGYGICNKSASWNELEGCLQRVYWQLVRRGGVHWTAPVALCQLDQGFFGIGCPHPGVECLVAQLTKLLIHYGCRLGLGIQMQVTIEVFLTELGLLSHPLQELFMAYGKWVMNTWLKSIWEKNDKFNITVGIAPLPIRPPWEGDKWFMQAVIEAGVTNADKLVKINRF